MTRWRWPLVALGLVLVSLGVRVTLLQREAWSEAVAHEKAGKPDDAIDGYRRVLRFYTPWGATDDAAAALLDNTTLTKVDVRKALESAGYGPGTAAFESLADHPRQSDAPGIRHMLSEELVEHSAVDIARVLTEQRSRFERMPHLFQEHRREDTLEILGDFFRGLLRTGLGTRRHCRHQRLGRVERLSCQHSRFDRGHRKSFRLN